MNPIITAIDAGHFQYTVTIEDAKKRIGVQAGETRCRSDHQEYPCQTILAARLAAGPPHGGPRKLHNDPLFLAPPR